MSREHCQVHRRSSTERGFKGKHSTYWNWFRRWAQMFVFQKKNLLFSSFRKSHWRYGSHSIEWSIKDKLDAHSSWPRKWGACKKRFHSKTIKSLFWGFISKTENEIGDTGAKALSDALKTNTVLAKLDLWSQNMQMTHLVGMWVVFSFGPNKQEMMLGIVVHQHWVKR